MRHAATYALRLACWHESPAMGCAANLASKGLPAPSAAAAAAFEKASRDHKASGGSGAGGGSGGDYLRVLDKYIAARLRGIDAGIG